MNNQIHRMRQNSVHIAALAHICPPHTIFMTPTHRLHQTWQWRFTSIAKTTSIAHPSILHDHHIAHTNIWPTHIHNHRRDAHQHQQWFPPSQDPYHRPLLQCEWAVAIEDEGVLSSSCKGQTLSNIKKHFFFGEQNNFILATRNEMKKVEFHFPNFLSLFFWFLNLKGISQVHKFPLHFLKGELPILFRVRSKSLPCLKENNSRNSILWIY